MRTRREGGGAKGGGGKDGVSRVPVRNSLSQFTEKLRKRILRCFKSLRYGKILCISGGHHNFLSKVF